MKIRKYLNETTIAGQFTDTGGICGDDDYPPGNINFGEKMVPELIPSINGLIKRFISDPNFTWEEFDNCIGMEDIDNYHSSLQKLKEVLPDFDIEKHLKKKIKKSNKIPSKEDPAIVKMQYKDAKHSDDYPERVQLGDPDSDDDNSLKESGVIKTVNKYLE